MTPTKMMSFMFSVLMCLEGLCEATRANTLPAAILMRSRSDNPGVYV